jgi:hypothetical protein
MSKHPTHHAVNAAAARELNALTKMRPTVISDEEAEKAAYVVCILWSSDHYFLDNIMDTCCRCFRAVQLRPHAPKKPKRICMECVTTPVH